MRTKLAFAVFAAFAAAAPVHAGVELIAAGSLDAHQGDRAVSAGELAEHLYGVAESSDTNAIEALVTRLRRKFGADVVQTRRGFGYLLASSS